MEFEDDIYEYIAEQFDIQVDQARLLATDWKGLLQFLSKEQNFLRGQVSAYQNSIKAISERSEVFEGLSKL